MTYTYSLIPESKLPNNFKYPKSFLYYLKYNETQEETREYGCWEERIIIRNFEDNENEVLFFHRQLKHEYPARNFIPFGRLYDDLIYCFDGNDTSGDPTIYVVKTFINQWGIENQEFTTDYENFYEWLKISLEEGQEECGCWRAIVPYSKTDDDFKFPIEYINKIKIPDFDSFSDKNVYFISANECKDDYRDFYKIKETYSELNIVPFAKDKNDNIFIFDGNNKDGNPKIYLLSTVKYEILKEYISFSDWWNNLEDNFMFTKENHEK